MKRKSIRAVIAVLVITASAMATFGLSGCHLGDHTYDDGIITKAATCTEAGEKTYTCTVDGCDDSYTEVVPATGHDYTKTVHDPTCTEDGYTENKCKNCGDTYTETIPATGHSYVDTVVPPTCTEEGYTESVCSSCGDRKVTDAVSATGHSYAEAVVEPTCAEQGYTAHTCTSCGDTYADTYVEALGHDYQVTDHKDSTDAVAGYDTYTCTRCGDSYTNNLPAKGHDYDSGKIIKNPTCTEKGTKRYTCTSCGITYDETIAALGHNYDGGTVTTQPTCEKAGVKTFTCSRCSSTYTQEVTKLGHSWDNGTVTTQPTCESNGVRTYKCTRSGCSETKTEAVAALGHDYGEWKVTTEPTCTEKGVETRVCENDETHTETRDIEALGHTLAHVEAVEETCTADGNTEYYRCSVCAKYFSDSTCKTEIKLSDTVVGYLGHDYPEDDGDHTTPVKCTRCGLVETKSTDHVFSYTVTKAATCTEGGTKHGKCTVSGCSYEVDEVIPASGHTWAGGAVTEPSCTEDGYTTYTCIVCGDSYKETGKSAAGHNYSNVEITVAATCTAKGTKTYKCSNTGCTASYTEEISVTGHSAQPGTLSTRNTGCQYEDYYTCVNNGCGADVVVSTYYKHTYIAKIKTEATCKADGLKEYVCSSCGEAQKDDDGNAKTETISKDTAQHTWDGGVTANGVTTYTCSVCSAKKTVIEASSGGKSVSADKTALEKTAIKANEAEVSLNSDAYKAVTGQATSTEQITLSVEKYEKSGDTDEREKYITNLSEADKALLGDSPIYDFTLKQGETTISDFSNSADGAVTVTLPYTLGDGEDVDNIYVWYISDDGSLTEVNATYSNGYVTFTTSHFSYYTVTRLTPKLRCEKFGHNWVTKTIDPTCTTKGYTLSVCVRCAAEEKSGYVDALGHDYTEKRVNATCTENGSVTYTCLRCSDSYTEVLKATGHKYDFDTHHYDDEKFYRKPGCIEGGWERFVCIYCGEKEIKNEIKPMGHEYSWEWKDGVEPDCQHNGEKDYICDHGCGAHYEEVVVGFHDYVAGTPVEPDCYHDGYTPYECPVCHDSYHDDRVAHYEHELKEVDRVDATCTSAGYIKYVCKHCGGEKTEVLEKLEHSFKDGVCVYCGEAKECDHLLTKYVQVYLADYGACGINSEGETIVGNAEDNLVCIMTCECGENVMYDGDYYEMKACDVTTVKTTTDEDGRVTYSEEVCSVCGLKRISEYTYMAYGCAVKKCTKTLTIGDYSISYLRDLSSNHETEEKTVSISGICGGSVTETVCKNCGEVISVSGFTCDFTYSNYVDKCSDCGLVRTAGADISDKDEDCIRVYKSYYIYTLDGVEVLRVVSYSYVMADHDYEETVKVTDESDCLKGITITRVCKDCGYTYTYNYDGHYAYIVKEEKDLSSYGVEGTLKIYVCACGKETSYRLVDKNGNDILSDNYESESTVVDGVSHNVGTYTYGDGGLKKICDSYSLKENCIFTHYQADKIVAGDTVLYEGVNNREMGFAHNYIVTFALKGTSCEDGVRYDYTCQDCGYSYSETYTSHNTVKVESYSLTEYGVGGTIDFYSCGCGESGHVNINGYTDSTWDDNVRTWTYAFTDNEDLVVTVESGATAVNECKSINYNRVTVTLGGETKFDKTYKTGVNYNHTYVLTFNMYGDDCDDGYDVVKTCKYCGDSFTETNCTGHDTWTVESYNLSDYGACGGIIIYSICACGKETSLYGYPSSGFNYNRNTYVDEEGKMVYVSVRICSDGCGYVWRHSYYTDERDASTCTVATHYTEIFSCKNTLITKIERTDSAASHDYEVTYELDTDSKDCEDGVTCTYTCKDCGYSYTSHYTGHNSFEIARYDLSEYGSDCGGYAVEQSCACGYSHSISLEALCDFESTGEECWIEDRDTDCGSGGQKYTCAVTDPDLCGFVIRYCWYYKDIDSCTAQEYYTYQFGYDKTTGTCAKEIAFATNSYTTMHDYEAADTTVTIGGIEYSGTRYDCKNCDSYMITFNRENALGCNCGNYSDGITLPYETYDIVVKADGTEVWEKYVYGWNFSDCTVSITGTGSDVTESTYTTTHWTGGYSSGGTHYYEHWQHNEYTTIKENTCTQFGEEGRVYTCHICGSVASSNTITVSPTEHNRVQIGDGRYVCVTCGLEFAADASGEIVFEDLTDEYGNGENYVVGYYNRGGVTFTYYVSLVPKSGGTDNDIIIMSSAANPEYFTVLSTANGDAVNAIAFSEAQVKDSSTGYDLSAYDIRFTFVPTDSSGSFDYAITITDESSVPSTITEDGTYVVKADVDDVKIYTNYTFTVVSEKTVTWKIRLSGGYNCLITISGADNQIVQSTSNSTTFEFTAGETYYVYILSWYGLIYMPVIFELC